MPDILRTMILVRLCGDIVALADGIDMPFGDVGAIRVGYGMLSRQQSEFVKVWRL